MKKIGIIFGMESTFPPALVDKINSFHDPEIQAECRAIARDFAHTELDGLPDD